MTKTSSSKIYWCLLILAIGLFILLRLPQVLRGDFAFVFDMGRDHIWVRNMVELTKPTLIGPWGSLAGVYMGPAWYYLLSLPYILGGGDPRASVIAVMLANLGALLAGAWWLRRHISVKASMIFAFIFALSPLNINITTYPFHANILPVTQTLFLIALFYKRWWLAALATSLNFHFEPAAGIFTTMTLILFFIRSIRPIRVIRNSLIAFTATLIPNIIFDLRHQFLQTQAVIAYFKGQNRSLEGILPYPERIFERLRKFSELFSASTFPNIPPLAAGLLLLCLLILLFKLKKTQSEKSLASLIIWPLIIPLLGFMFLFPPELKGWYIYGFSINYFILVALILSRVKIIFLVIYLIFLGQFHNRLPAVFKPFPPDPAVFSTQTQIVESIYRQAQGKPFSVYVYTPPIYDYQYQYLFWWLARKHHLALPVEYSYLPGETSYHPEKLSFSATGGKPEIIFLLLEPESDLGRLNGWLGHFAAYPVVETITLPGNLTLQTRQSLQL